ncbi:VanZ family protein [Thalassoglobus polymorphus]|uniref:VanZ family protein n=1 Tax=Thalassoglobus polymorphus TaxID=2527994 RepID=UPI0018D1F7B1|nr:VanZ family protein [Thalassoglobus polymorphus]
MNGYLQERSDSGTQVVSILRPIQLKSNEHLNNSDLARFESSILSARREHPEIVILSGISWNISSDEYSFDLTILFPETPEEFDNQRQFEKFVGTLEFETNTLESVKKTLSWLEKNAVHNGLRPVVISHSYRWLGESASEIVIPVAALMRVSELVLGFPIFPAQDRGFTPQVPSLDTLNSREESWNQLLKRDLNVLAAISSSQTTTDPPTPLTETWIQTSEPTSNGVLLALHSGDFYSGQGGIATELDFSVAINGLEQAVPSGGAITVPAETLLTVSFACKIPEQDLTGEPNWLDSIELVCISESGVETLVENTIQLGNANHQWDLKTPNGGVVVRACARRSVDGGEDYLVYTNPIFIKSEFTPEPWSASKSLASVSALQIFGFLGSVIAAATIFFVLSKVSHRAKEGRSRRIEIASKLPALADQPEADWTPPTEETSPQIKPHPDAPSNGAISIPTRGQFALAGCLVTLFAIYGSLVPLNYQPLPFDSAVERFLDTPFLQIDVNRRQDWVANILLYVPLGYFWASAFIFDRNNFAVRALLCSSVALILTGIAIGTEFLQIWFPPRTVSQNDIIAEAIGATLGSVVALATIQASVKWFRQMIRLSNPGASLDWFLQLYILALFFATLMPFDFILNSAELAAKVQAGRISAQFPEFSSATLANLLGTSIMFFPIGIWTSRWQDRASHRSLWKALSLTVCIPIFLEIIQIPVFSRYATLTGMLAGVVGALMGFHVTRHFGGSITNRLLEAPEKRASRTVSTVVIIASYLTGLAIFYVGPLRPGVLGETIFRLQNFWQVPFARLYWGTELNAFLTISRQLALLAPIGFLLGDLALSSETLKQTKWRFGASVLLLAMIATLLEIGQVWNMDRYADVTDAILLGIGGILGLVIRPALIDFAKFGFLDSTQRLVTLRRVLFLGALGAIGLIGTATASYQTTHFSLTQSLPKERHVDLVVDREWLSDKFRIQNIIVPTTDFPEAIWGSTGADSSGNIWFGVSDGREHLPSARVFKLDPVGGTLTEVGSILPELRRLGLLREGESQSKVHSKFVEAEDGYLYFASMDEKGEASDGSQLPTWGSHLWRIHPQIQVFEHLASVPEGLIAVSGGGRWIYSLGLFDHILYQWDVREKELKHVRVGAIGGHISRNFITDLRGHAYVPRLTHTGSILDRPKNPTSKDSDVTVELVEYDTSLREVGSTPLSNYLTESYWENHGIVGVSTLSNGSILFTTSRGFLFRITPSQAGSKSYVQPLNWIHPDGPSYAPSLFAGKSDQTVAAVVYGKDRFEWSEFNLRTYQAKTSPLQLPLLTEGKKGVLLYGSQTQDKFGACYVVGRVYNTPIVLRIESLR